MINTRRIESYEVTKLGRERGAITIAESLIVVAIGITIFIVWAQAQAVKQQHENARQAGRAIASYARAASIMLAESPSATNETLNISDLQDCTTDTGVRFLACSQGPETPIPFAITTDGTQITYDDLEIDVTVTAAGATGTIDFGVFRSGVIDDTGLADSRPDLAALALTEAREDTGAGVLGYFDIEFVREDPSNLVFDKNNENFDQAAIEELASLRATIGTLAGSAPFLRLDGSNKMTGGITFSNSMSIEPDGNDLAFAGTGNIKVTAASLKVESNTETPTLTAADITASKSVTITAALGARGTGFEHLDQSGEITNMKADISANVTGLESLGVKIDANKNKFDDYWTKSESSDNYYLKSELDTKFSDIESEIVFADEITETVTSELSAACSPSLATRNAEMISRGYHNPTCPSGTDSATQHSVKRKNYKSRNATDFTCTTLQKTYWKRITCRQVR